MTADGRAEFERWAVSQGYNINPAPSGALYWNNNTWHCWEAWQAAWNAKPTEPAGDECPHCDTAGRCTYVCEQPSGIPVIPEAELTEIAEYLRSRRCAWLATGLERGRNQDREVLDIVLEKLRPYLRQPVQASGQHVVRCRFCGVAAPEYHEMNCAHNPRGPEDGYVD